MSMNERTGLQYAYLEELGVGFTERSDQALSCLQIGFAAQLQEGTATQKEAEAEQTIKESVLAVSKG